MYADTMTDSMNRAISETNRRRGIQKEYNERNGITPTTISKKVRDLISVTKKVDKEHYGIKKDFESMSFKELEAAARKVMKQMQNAAAELNFELAAQLRDEMLEIRKKMNEK